MQAMVSPSRPYVVLHKPVGQTPLQAMEAWKREHPAYADIPVTYAGRLDPMAEGALLVLLGDECKRKDAYLGLDKEYEVEILLDVATDTGDVLGMPAYADILSDPADRKIRQILRTETGTRDVPYPAFSSKTVHGKPLFQYALEGALGTIEIPSHPETIYRIKNTGSNLATKEELRERIMEMLSLAPRTNEPSKALGADFRQDAIRAAWEAVFAAMPDREFRILRLSAACASGTYMRSLAERIGKGLGTRSTALSIRRTRIGRYRKIADLGFWTKRYA